VFAFSQQTVTLNGLSLFNSEYPVTSVPPPAKMTDYCSFFRFLKATIAADIDALCTELASDVPTWDKRGILRPALFLVVSTEPHDDRWMAEFDALMAEPWHPEVIIVDVGDLHPKTLRRMATLLAARTKDPALVGKMVVDFIRDHFRTKNSGSYPTSHGVFGMELLWNSGR
jgi:hypothetical protein